MPTDAGAGHGSLSHLLAEQSMAVTDGPLDLPSHVTCCTSVTEYDAGIVREIDFQQVLPRTGRGPDKAETGKRK
ncbi:MAG: hypothetical protein KDA85_04185, partial [Planctomycetaceae bacterium]|nr:hypothetical protein [Planctomycetaceae bacterium]